MTTEPGVQMNGNTTAGEEARVAEPTGSRTEAEVAARVGAESVRYLSVAGLVESIQIPETGLCLGCLNARYPVEVPEEHRRFQKSLEEF